MVIKKHEKNIKICHHDKTIVYDPPHSRIKVVLLNYWNLCLENKHFFLLGCGIIPLDHHPKGFLRSGCCSRESISPFFCKKLEPQLHSRKKYQLYHWQIEAIDPRKITQVGELVTNN